MSLGIYVGRFFTKALGGTLFVAMREICQGLIPLEELKLQQKYKIDKYEENKIEKQNSKVLKEHVENMLPKQKKDQSVKSTIEDIVHNQQKDTDVKLISEEC